MPPSTAHRLVRRLAGALLAAVAVFPGIALHAQEPPHHHAPAGPPPAPFVASTARSFAALMDDAMAVMHYGMRAAPLDGTPEHDFMTMMIPHHQGAIDMAKAVLLHTQDPELRNLAQSIITEQNNEIALMQAWLARHAGSGPNEHPPEVATVRDPQP